MRDMDLSHEVVTTPHIGAATLDDVVEHYRMALGLALTARQRADLVEYLKSL